MFFESMFETYIVPLDIKGFICYFAKWRYRTILRLVIWLLKQPEHPSYFRSKYAIVLVVIDC